MNYELPQINSKGGVNKAMLTPQFETSYKAALTEIDKFIKNLTGDDFKWFFMGIDEPGAFLSRQDRAIWEYRLAKSAGLQGAAFMHGPFWKKLAPYNRVNIFSYIDYTQENLGTLLAELKQYENLPYQYGASGVYGNIPGGLMPSRWGTGFFAWKTRSRGQISWIYSLHRKIDPEGTAHMSWYPTITYADKNGSLISTLQWEGIREGIDDYCYLYTLMKIISSAKKVPKNSKDAIEIEYKLEKLLSCVPWNDLGKIPKFDNDGASKLRWQIASWIMKLRGQEK
ncbi:MAG: hypothetical protein WCS27_16495 [Victivallaceae bacterium]|jgi:hypothetical protein